MNPDIHTPFTSYEDAINRLLPYHLLLTSKNNSFSSDTFISKEALDMLSKVNGRILKFDESQIFYETFLNLKCMLESQRISSMKGDKNPGPSPTPQALQQGKSAEFQQSSKLSSIHYTNQTTGIMYNKQTPSFSYPVSVSNAPQINYNQSLSTSQNFVIPATQFQGYPLGFVPKVFPSQSVSQSPIVFHPQYLPYNFQGYPTALPYYQFSNSQNFHSNQPGPISNATPPITNFHSYKRPASDLANVPTSIVKRQSN